MRSRDWIDYLPSEADRDRARSDASYRAAIEETAVGRLAHLQAEAAPLRDAADALSEASLRWLARLGGPFRVW